MIKLQVWESSMQCLHVEYESDKQERYPETCHKIEERRWLHDILKERKLDDVEERGSQKTMKNW